LVPLLRIWDDEGHLFAGRADPEGGASWES
jgi:hypothetical protein